MISWGHTCTVNAIDDCHLSSPGAVPYSPAQSTSASQSSDAHGHRLQVTARTSEPPETFRVGGQLLGSIGFNNWVNPR